MQKLRSIQVLRAVAACAVVVLHAYPQVEMHNGAAVRELGRASYGAAGVDLFFVISGFIMANVAQEREASEFLRDRFWRIYPLWWIAVLPWLFWLPRGPTFIVSSLTLWPIYGVGYFVPVLKVGWTLSFELLFYVGMTVAIATRRWLPLAAYAFLLVGALTTSSALLHFVGNPMALEFLMGVLVARLPRRAAFAAFIPLGLAMFAMTGGGTGDVDSTLQPHFALWRALQWGIPAAFIVWGALSIEKLFADRRFDIPVALGDASYSIYLFHPIIAYGFQLPGPVRVLFAIGIGWTVHVLVERRILAMRRRWPTMRFNRGQVKAA